MEDETKIIISKTLISTALVAASICMWVVLTIPAIRDISISYFPLWSNITMASSAIVLTIGLLLGSRGIGDRLTLINLLKQVFSFPSVIPAIVYIIGLILTFIYT